MRQTIFRSTTAFKIVRAITAPAPLELSPPPLAAYAKTVSAA
jgi:hypothetical protein